MRRPKIKRPIERKSITPAQFRNFIFAGRSVFTLENNETKNYITFRIKQIKRLGKIIPNQFGIECKVLGDNTAGYNFLGFLDLNKKTFKRWSRLPNDYVGYKTLFWLLQNLESIEDLKCYPKLAIYHEGCCCKCGRPLTVPESIDSGIGPECKENMLKASIDIMTKAGIWEDILSYDDNVRKALKTDPTLWSKLHVPDYIKPEEAFKGHRLLSRLSIL
jgi:hypothetical protein